MIFRKGPSLILKRQAVTQQRLADILHRCGQCQCSIFENASCLEYNHFYLLALVLTAAAAILTVIQHLQEFTNII